MTNREASLMGFVIGIIFWASFLEIRHNHLEKEAHECAVTSIGTDSAIEHCYTERKLPFPGY